MALWTNAGVKGLIEKYGDRINSISLNNGKHLFIGYKSSPQLSDITFDTIGGTDVMIIKQKDISHGTPGIDFETLLTTEFIEAINILSEKDVDKRLDPLMLR